MFFGRIKLCTCTMLRLKDLLQVYKNMGGAERQYHIEAWCSIIHDRMVDLTVENMNHSKCHWAENDYICCIPADKHLLGVHVHAPEGCMLLRVAILSVDLSELISWVLHCLSCHKWYFGSMKGSEVRSGEQSLNQWRKTPGGTTVNRCHSRCSTKRS